jgi:surface antigen-like variable number repeat protein
MNGRGAARAILLGVFCASLFSAPLRAQSPTETPNCPLTPSQAELLRNLSHQDERQQVFIETVDFDGLIHLPDSARQKLIAELKAKTFFADVDWLKEVEQDARWAWDDAGYLTAVAEVIPQLIGSDSTGQRVSVSIRTQEGEQFRLGDLRIVDVFTEDRPSLRARKDSTEEAEEIRDDDAAPDVTSAGFPVEELRELIPLKRGELFSVLKIREGLEALTRLYGSRGYIDFTAVPSMNIDQENRLVNLTLELNQQVQYRVRNVEVMGADPAIEEQLKSILKSGEPFDALKLSAFFKENSERLPPQALQRRSDVHRDTNTANVDLRFDLRPCPTTID